MNTDKERNSLLWVSFISGDNTAYAQLYKLNVMALFSYGMRFTSNREAVKDCIHDVFVKIYNNRDKIPVVDNVKLYLFISLKNTLFNFFKKDNLHYHIDSIEPTFFIDYSMENTLQESDELIEKKKKIAKMMDSLTPRQREIIYYRFQEELSYDEICKLMKMNYQSVRNLIHRSLERIRKSYHPDL